MIVLAAGTIELIQMVTSGTADIDYNTAVVDHTTSGDTFAARKKAANVAAAATTTIVDAPGAGKIGNVKWISARNKHASSANTLTFRHTDGTTTVELFKTTLQAGECVVMNGDGVWFVYDTNGGVKVGASAASDTLAGLIQIATQGDLEAASSVVVAVTPGRQHFHPGMAKFWAQVTGAGTPSLTTNYNVTSVADTGVGRMTVTIATDFSSANWCCQVAVFSSATSADEGIPNIQAKAAGTVEVGNRIITPAAADPAVGYDVAGYGDQA